MKTKLVLGAVALVVATAAAGRLPGEGPASPERSLTLLEGARKEGAVTIYTSMPAEDMNALTTAFTQRYGVRANVWRASSDKVVARLITEARAGRFDADIVETNGPQLEALARERLLQPVRSGVQADLIPQALPTHRAWVGSRLSVFVQAYNTRLVPRAEVPQRWQDLLHPRWKGRLAVEADDADWFSAVAGALGEEKGIGLFRDIVRANGISARKGHSLLAQMVAAGEVPLALTVYNYKAQQLKESGAPVEWFVIAPAIARANGIGITARPKSPHAAVLFYEFELGDQGQRILADREYVPSAKGVDAGLGNTPLRFIDAATMLDHAERWRSVFKEIFLQGGR
jgi:iron(III) transport system substrate-binding protein